MAQFTKGQKVFWVQATQNDIQISAVTIESCGMKLAKVAEVDWKFAMYNQKRLFATIEQATEQANIVAQQQNLPVVVL